MSKSICFIFVFIISCFEFISATQTRVKFKELRYYSKNYSNLVVNDNKELKDKEFLIAVVIQNHQYSLPTFLATLETLKCPNEKSKCNLWILFDKCTDKSKDIFVDWLQLTRSLFDKITMVNTENDEKTKEKHAELTDHYFSVNKKKRAIKYAIDNKISYVFFLTADIVLTNPNTLEILLKKKKTIAAPLLTSPSTKHSTFWLNIDNVISGSNKMYFPIYDREKLGCFKVVGVHDCYLINLDDERTHKLIDMKEIYNNDDVELSFEAFVNNILMHVCNRETFGYIPDTGNFDPENEKERFIYMRMEHLLAGVNRSYNEPLPVSTLISEELVKRRPNKFGFDQIYVINLERREDRRKRIESALNDLDLKYKIFKAVDANEINEEYIKNLGIKPIPDYIDPYHNRPLNYGEICCFLSHYFVWKEMVEKKYERIIILEDDARFQFNFRPTFKHLINEMKTNNIQWELLYLGRKIMREHASEEEWIENISYLDGYGIIKPSYTHWTVAYALTLNGAKKLLAQEPLKKLLPVDEYLPIMFDKQPNQYWASFFSPRDVIAYAIQPSIIVPTHYYGDPSYISDTEFTQVLNLTSDEDTDETSRLIIGEATQKHTEL